MSSILLYTGRITSYWRLMRHGERRTGMPDPRIIAALVFYHEYFHLIAHHLNLDLEAYAEFFAAARTIYEVPDMVYGEDFFDVAEYPVRSDSVSLNALRLTTIYAAQPVGVHRFLGLPRREPYKRVREIWDDFFLLAAVNYLFNESLHHDEDMESMDENSLRRRLMKSGVADALEELAEPIVIAPITYMLYRTGTRPRPGRCGVEAEVVVYLIRDPLPH